MTLPNDTIPDHYVLDPMNGTQRLIPVGFWNVNHRTSIAVYSISGRKPNWLKRLVVYLVMGWTWTDVVKRRP